MKSITELLTECQDSKFADFQAKLIPAVDRAAIIGVRTPKIRAIAKELTKDKEMQDTVRSFLEELPHTYFDENALHGEIISLEKDFERAIAQVEKFLPYIDNWAVCDLLSPKSFAKHKDRLLERIKVWLESGRVYTMRFAIDMLIKYFLDGEFDAAHLELVRTAKGEDYYVKMAKAWYFSFALIKHYETALEYFKTVPLDRWIFKKSIQKARESYRLNDERKEELKALLKHE